MKITLIRVESEDLEKARDIGKQRLIDEHPELEGMKISDRYLFKRIVKYYIED